MSSRTNILARLRRWNAGAARYVVASFAVAYVAAATAPCAAATGEATGGASPAAREHGASDDSAHGGHARAAHAAGHAHEAHGSEPAPHGSEPLPAGGRGAPCTHCPAGAAVAGSSGHASCAALEDLTNVAASKGEETPHALPPFPPPAAFMLPPALASPPAPPPLRAVGLPCVSLNLRHCVFLI